jgi:syntaxin 16
MQVATSDSLAAERDHEVQNILRSVNDLAQVMKDLSVLVIDQGSILDRIDYNTEQVAKTVESGLAQVVKAEKTQKKGRMMMCIMLLMAAVVFMLVFVLIEKIIF